MSTGGTGRHVGADPSRRLPGGLWGETAALRNLANAASLLKVNPALLQLRLVQQLAATTGHTVVIGQAPLGA